MTYIAQTMKFPGSALNFMCVTYMLADMVYLWVYWEEQKLLPPFLLSFHLAEGFGIYILLWFVRSCVVGIDGWLLLHLVVFKCNSSMLRYVNIMKSALHLSISVLSCPPIFIRPSLNGLPSSFCLNCKYSLLVHCVLWFQSNYWISICGFHMDDALHYKVSVSSSWAISSHGLSI